MHYAYPLQLLLLRIDFIFSVFNRFLIPGVNHVETPKEEAGGYSVLLARIPVLSEGQASTYRSKRRLYRYVGY